MQKPSLPSGTRDFGPEVYQKRKSIMNVMERIFKLHGFVGIETPALENLATLQGKYGDEGDQLLFKVLNSGEYLSKVSPEDIQIIKYNELTPQIASRGLRYDLTVPLARFVVMNRSTLTFPFKRFQMQPVWRADRPQKGRYREFWQCDIDIVGANHLLSEAELVEMYIEVFQELDLGIDVKINHRKVLDSFLPLAGNESAWNSFMQAIDKFDKIGQEGVANELEQRGLSHMIPTWNKWCSLADAGSFEAIIAGLKGIEAIQNEHLQEGIEALMKLWQLLSSFPQAKLDLRLARGLSYYTGCVFEVVPNDVRLPKDFRIGSIGGGGRYDNLTGIFGLKDVSGVGVSFGLDRIYDTLEACGTTANEKAEHGVLICSMLENGEVRAFEIARELRKNGIEVEVYPGSVKLKKQLDYGNATKKRFALILGETELANGTVSVKDLKDGSQHEASQDSLLAFLQDA